MRFKDIFSRFLVFYKKAILINFTKFTGKQLYRGLFFDKVLGLMFQKKDSRTTAGRLFLLNTLYSLSRPQPQNVTFDLAYSLFINYKHFSSKYWESLVVQINKIKFVKLTHSLWKNGATANKDYCNQFCGINKHP